MCGGPRAILFLYSLLTSKKMLGWTSLWMAFGVDILNAVSWMFEFLIHMLHQTRDMLMARNRICFFCSTCDVCYWGHIASETQRLLLSTNSLPLSWHLNGEMSTVCMCCDGLAPLLRSAIACVHGAQLSISFIGLHHCRWRNLVTNIGGPH